ncbi:hypothetical protein ILUMI_25131 [Ignelater luminosus]|uniref:Uncharacterized protein n=1 Tax=Ignelater luminosus TaxID=2038154 RepID=A0A8K0CAJ4_IGNLU|nr:hypothetical protein ILUMI_25131 [Ignelater luminosus]
MKPWSEHPRSTWKQSPNSSCHHRNNTRVERKKLAQAKKLPTADFIRSKQEQFERQSGNPTSDESKTTDELVEKISQDIQTATKKMDTSEITKDEIKLTLKQTKNGKAPGKDSITTDMLKLGGITLEESLESGERSVKRYQNETSQSEGTREVHDHKQKNEEKGYMKPKHVRMFWEMKSETHNEAISSSMRRNRFLETQHLPLLSALRENEKEAFNIVATEDKHGDFNDFEDSESELGPKHCELEDDDREESGAEEVINKKETPNKDTCDTYNELHAKTLNKQAADIKQKYIDLHYEHLNITKEARQMMTTDLEGITKNLKSEAITYDLEKVLGLPKFRTNIVYYKRQLSLYNEGIHTGSDVRDSSRYQFGSDLSYFEENDSYGSSSITSEENFVDLASTGIIGENDFKKQKKINKRLSKKRGSVPDQLPETDEEDDKLEETD